MVVMNVALILRLVLPVLLSPLDSQLFNNLLLSVFKLFSNQWRGIKGKYTIKALLLVVLQILSSDFENQHNLNVNIIARLPILALTAKLLGLREASPDVAVIGLRVIAALLESEVFDPVIAEPMLLERMISCMTSRSDEVAEAALVCIAQCLGTAEHTSVLVSKGVIDSVLTPY